jgi:hypothetical protein
MATAYEDSSSIPEKLVLLVFIAGIVIGNVSLVDNIQIIYSFLLKSNLDLCIYHVYRTW